MLFREVQGFRQKRQRWMLAIPPLALSGIAFFQIVLHHPWGLHPMSDGGILGLTIFLWLIYIRLITVRMVTEVDARAVSVAFRGLWRKRSVPVEVIQAASVITFDPGHDYGGFGFRSTNRGQAYLASGSRGVRIQSTDGSELVLGSARPDALADAIARARSEMEVPKNANS